MKGEQKRNIQREKFKSEIEIFIQICYDNLNKFKAIMANNLIYRFI